MKYIADCSNPVGHGNAVSLHFMNLESAVYSNPRFDSHYATVTGQLSQVNCYNWFPVPAWESVNPESIVEKL